LAKFIRLKTPKERHGPMPELPEVETICCGLRPVLVGQKIIKAVKNRHNLRFALADKFVDLIQGTEISAIKRRGKYIIFTLSNNYVILSHLGMSGRFLIKETGYQDSYKHTHVIFYTENHQILYQDPRRFGFMILLTKQESQQHPMLTKMGPEPLEQELTAPYLYAQARGRRVPLKNFLLNQQIIAGLGNIYVSEALFHAGLSPLRAAMSLRLEEAERLVLAIQEVIRTAIAAGGSSLRDYRQASGLLGYFQERHAVYGRQGQACPGCICDWPAKGGIERQVQAGRSSYYCPVRQK
jgi:formamidopyrimidine-DNA glycosylase